MTTMVRAPAKTSDGYCLAKCERILKDSWGKEMIEVIALHGTPWSDASHGGWCPTNRARFYPDQLVVERTEPDNG